VQVVLDLVVVGEDELPELDALGQTFAETEAAWVLAPPEEWAAKLGSGKAHHWNLAGITYTDATLQLHRLQRKQETGVLGILDTPTVESIWASVDMELRYFANADDERYSIQAHPTLLRNILSQAKEYPVFVSDPVTISW
jgi:hypothetical protein